MPAAIIKKQVGSAIASTGSLDNWVGITAENLPRFLVEPYQVTVLFEDGDGRPQKPMWIVLHECPRAPRSGFSLAFDPVSQGWGVVEHLPSSGYRLVTLADSFAEALQSL